MKSILKKVAGVAVAAVLALGMFSCSNGIDYPVKQTVATPVFSVASGAVNSGTSVTISCATEGAKIYYTTDDSDPTASSTEYKAAISVMEAVTLKAIAIKDGMNDSAVASVSYTIKGTVATPAFSVASGAVNSGTSVTISCSTVGAKIYYTTDSSDPTASSTEYTAAISVTEAVTLKAIAVKDGMNDSAVASASYTIKPDYSKCAVGDFVLKDGTILSKDETPESGTVAAVIVRAATNDKPAFGVGIVHKKSAWCTESAAGYNTNITALVGNKTSDYMDGSDGWEKLKEACSDAESKPENYPAWNYSLTYAKNNGLTADLATGWYLPTMAELYTIYQNKTAVDASLLKAGGSQFGTSWYWSCCQERSYDDYARVLDFRYGYMYYNSKDGNNKSNASICVCSVRAFN
nr:chitobiase/beta-hexosaminidase C-terminal domain-containing protein [uncultured Treponema sp.]